MASDPPALTLRADGFSTAHIRFDAPQASIGIVDGTHRIRIESVAPARGGTEALLRAGVLAGRAVLEARADGFAPARVNVSLQADATDRDGDGMPDVFTLTDEADREAFAQWFTLLAEAQYAARTLPPEIDDCAALVRFAYREALREHDAAQAAALRLPLLPPAGGVRKYQYPYTPAGASLFQTAAGFSEFADAETLMRRNTYFVTRDIRRAAPADLLFYRQLDQSMPFHVMVYAGRSRIEPGGPPVVVYHTGPIGKRPGEVRRLTVLELLRHPSPRWRPVPGNTNFLGFFRWNILKES